MFKMYMCNKKIQLCLLYELILRYIQTWMLCTVSIQFRNFALDCLETVRIKLLNNAVCPHLLREQQCYGVKM
jgi:hypothetical protein